MTWVLMKFLRVQVEVGDGEGFVLGSYLHFIGKETGSQRVSGLPEAMNLGLKAGSDSKLRACLSLPSCSLMPPLEIPQHKSFVGMLTLSLSPEDAEPLMRSSVPEMGGMWVPVYLRGLSGGAICDWITPGKSLEDTNCGGRGEGWVGGCGTQLGACRAAMTQHVCSQLHPLKPRAQAFETERLPALVMSRCDRCELATASVLGISVGPTFCQCRPPDLV